MTLAELCDAIHNAWQQIARLEKDDCDSKPGAPATPEAIDRLLATYDCLPADYVEFLRIHDGWEHISWGHILLPIDELLGENAKEHFGDLVEIERDNDRELGEIIGILWSENDANMLYVDPADSTLVSYHYEELSRYDTFREYLEECLEHVEQWLGTINRQQTHLVRDQQSAFRQQAASEIQSKALEQLVNAPPATESSEVASTVDLTVVPAYVRRVQWRKDAKLGDPEGEAWLCLTLGLYLGHAPTADEMRDALRAWRRLGASAAPVQARPYGGIGEKTLADPDDEASWQELVDATPVGGRYGLAWIETSGSKEESDPQCRTFSIRVFAEAELKPAAPLCLATFPPDTDPKLLPPLAKALVEALPVRSGLGGFEARWSTPNGMSTCYDWCRQRFGLDLQDPDMVYPPLRQGVRSASWLTVLGPTLATAVEQSRRLEQLPNTIELTRAANGGLVIRAGDAPDLRPIDEGVPELVGAVERVIEPLKIGSPHDAQKMRVFTQFEITDDRYGPWLYRYQDPTRFLTHTTWELASLAPEIAEKGTTEEIIDLARVAAAIEVAPENTRLARALYNAGCAATRRGKREAALSLYETCLDLPNCLVQTFGNLIVCYIECGQIDSACELAEANLWREEPYIFVNGACAYGERGDAERALELLQRGLAAGFDKPEAIRDDDSLALLRDDPRFLALFE